MRNNSQKIWILLLLNVVAITAESQTVNMHLWATGENHNKAVKTVPLLDNYQMLENGDDVFSRYGSDSRIRAAATGFYYTQKIDGRWWIIDPDGYAGINMAVTSLPDLTGVNADGAFDVLKKNGYNGTGNFLAKENMTKVQNNDKLAEKISYTRRKNFFARYMTDRQAFYSTPQKVANNPQNYITVFDPEFVTFADDFASTFANYKNERDLLGYFSDNEINFTEEQLYLFLSDLPATDPNYLVAMDFIASKGLTKSQVLANYNNYVALQNEFMGMIMERYYSVVVAAIKKYDPNHLYLGSRLHGKARNSETAVTVAAKYSDIVSVNYYNYVFPSDQIASPQKWGKWLAVHDKPALVTEFYAKAYNANYPEQPGAGFYTDDQAGRGIFYQSSCLDLLRSKYYVGWQYFRWQDDPAPKFSNKGMVNASNQEYTGMTTYMEELNRQVYQLIDYIDGRSHNSNTYNVTIPVSHDTYVQLSGANQAEVNGDKDFLSLSTPIASTGLREIFLQFDLGEYADSLDRLEDAHIRLHYLSGDNNQLFTGYGVKSNNWNEESLSGASGTILNSVRAVYGKGRMKNFITTVAGAPVRINVRNWLLNEVNSSNVSFRIVSGNTGIYNSNWASKEHSNISYRPVLLLKFKKQTNTGVSQVEETAYNVKLTDNRLEISGEFNHAFFRIYDLSGRMVSMNSMNSNQSDKLMLDKGFYILKLNIENEMLTQKIQIR